eukprot:gene12393-biopygen9486
MVRAHCNVRGHLFAFQLPVVENKASWTAPLGRHTPSSPATTQLAAALKAPAHLGSECSADCRGDVGSQAHSTKRHFCQITNAPVLPHTHPAVCKARAALLGAALAGARLDRYVDPVFQASLPG